MCSQRLETKETEDDEAVDDGGGGGFDDSLVKIS